jgi:hypothetical protein
MDSEHELKIRDAAIKDIRNHPPEVVVALGRMLASGAQVTPDPKRANFFEIETDSLIYYVHISPVTGNILLLGTWPAQGALERALQTVG